MNVSSVNGISNSLYCQGSKPAKKGELDNGGINFGANPLKATPLPLKENLVRGAKQAGIFASFISIVGGGGAFIGAKLFGTPKTIQKVEQAAARQADSLKNIINIKDADIHRLTTKSDALSDANEVLTKKVTQLENDTAYYLDVIGRINSDPLPVKYKIIKDKKTQEAQIFFELPLDSITTSNGNTYVLKERADKGVFTKNKRGVSAIAAHYIYDAKNKRKMVRDINGEGIQVCYTLKPSEIQDIMKKDPEAKKIINKSIEKGFDFSNDTCLRFFENTPNNDIVNPKFWYKGGEIDLTNSRYERVHMGANDREHTHKMNLNRTDKK